MKKRAQITIEFVMLIAAGIAFSLLFVLITGEKIQKVFSDKDYISSKDFALSMQKEIVIASQVESGYMREIIVPTDIDGTEFEITISNNTLIVVGDKFEHVLPLPNTQGQFIKGQTNTISNTQSAVVVN